LVFLTADFGVRDFEEVLRGVMPVVAFEFLLGVVFIFAEFGVLADPILPVGVVVVAPPAPARLIGVLLFGVLIIGGADCRPQEIEVTVSEELWEALSISCSNLTKSGSAP